MIQLIAIDGYLHYPPNPEREYRPDEEIILLHRYPEGDCDCVRWPNPDMKILKSCLFDDRECGVIEDGVILPDGTEVRP
jgi:hypothetical protein